MLEYYLNRLQRDDGKHKAIIRQSLASFALKFIVRFRIVVAILDAFHFPVSTPNADVDGNLLQCYIGIYNS